MKSSDNPATRANYEHWTPTPGTINAYATSIGLTSTSFATGPAVTSGIANVDGNMATLTDYGRLYEGVADGSLFSGTFRGLVLREHEQTPASRGRRERLRIWETLVAMVEAEKPAGMADELRDDFLDGMTANHKGGSYYPLLRDELQHPFQLARLGRLGALPDVRVGQHHKPQLQSGARSSTALRSTNWTSGNTPAENAITAVRAEPLREQLRAALAGWGACYPPDVTVTTTPAAPPAGQDGWFNAADLAANGGVITVKVSATDDSGVTDLQCTVNSNSVTVGSQTGSTRTRLLHAVGGRDP